MFTYETRTWPSHTLGAERLDGGLVRIWCSCGWRGDESPGGKPLTVDDKARLSRPWANHVSLSLDIASSVQ